MLIFNDEDHVESWEDGGHEVNVVVRFGVVPAAEHGIRRRQYRAPRVQSCCDTSLWIIQTGNPYILLNPFILQNNPQALKSASAKLEGDNFMRLIFI